MEKQMNEQMNAETNSHINAGTNPEINAEMHAETHQEEINSKMHQAVSESLDSQKDNDNEKTIGHHRLYDEVIIKNLVIFAVSFSISLALFMLKINKVTPEGKYISNITPYALMIILYTLLVLVLNLVAAKIKLTAFLIENKRNKILACVLSIGAMILNILAIVRLYTTELDIYDAPVDDRLIYHNNDYIFLICMGIVFCLTVAVMESMKSRIHENALTKLTFWAITAFVAVMIMYVKYTPGIYTAEFNFHHNNAYFNSVYRAVMGYPRTSLDTGIYGCYALLLGPIVALAGGSLNSFYVVLGVISALAVVAVALAIDTFVKTPVIKVIGVCMLPVTEMAMQWGVYSQIFPHRILFPALFVGYIALVHRFSNKEKSGFGWMAGGYVLALVSIIWSTEIGLICALSWTAYCMYDSLCRYKLSNWKLYVEVIIYLILFVASFVGAIVVAGLINVSMGGEMISFADFIFPLASQDYMVDILFIAIAKTLQPWIMILGVFLLFFAHSLSKTRFLFWKNEYSTELKGRARAFFGVSILGIGQMIYFINRATYGNVMVCYHLIVFFLAVLADYCFVSYATKRYKDIVHRICQVMSYVIVSIMLVVIMAGVCNFNSVEKFREELFYREDVYISGIANTIKEKLPENTPALGLGIAEIYSYIHWDSQYYPIDFADLGTKPEVADLYINNLNERTEPILISDRAIDDCERYSSMTLDKFKDRFEIKETFELFGEVFNYYVLK